MLRFVDCNMAVGTPNAPRGWRVYEPQAVREQAEQVGIVHGFAYHNGVLDLHPIDGNVAMDLIAEKDPFFSPVWAVIPNHTGEFYDATVLKELLDEHNVEMVRMFPRYNCHSFSLSDWCMGEVLAMLEKRETPVLLDQDQVEWEAVHRLCQEHPKLNVIITNMYYRHARYVMALMKCHKNLYLESSGTKSFQLLQTFCQQCGADRMVFGSNLGTFSAGSAACLVTYALISGKEKEQIAHGTLETLLQRQLTEGGSGK